MRRLTFVGENKTVTSTDDMRLTSTATGTAIRYQARFAFKGVAKLASPFLRSSFEKLADETADQLRGAPGEAQCSAVGLPPEPDGNGHAGYRDPDAQATRRRPPNERRAERAADEEPDG